MEHYNKFMRYYDMKHARSVLKYEFDCIILSRFTKKKKNANTSTAWPRYLNPIL